MNNKALSGVVTTVIMIGLVVAAISIVWIFVNNFVTDEIAGAESCFEVFDQIKIGEYTCKGFIDEDDNQQVNEGEKTYLKLSIKVGTTDLDELLVSIGGEEETKSFRLTKEGTSESFLGTKNPETEAENYGEKVYLPEKESAKSYFINMETFNIHNPYKIEITPIVGGESCDIADVYLEIP
ncbi:hypothetical protein J4429_03360 [Candidatus Pacearchaeota archaeon]|nr:hypothetical protein [Candidatus Pacearchaeota archaeon]